MEIKTYIFKRDVNYSMFKKIIEKLTFDSCKAKVADDINAFDESEKKKLEKEEK